MEAEMGMTIKDCQGVTVRDYQHRGQYLEGDKVWYQHQDSNAWLGPTEVLYHKENKVCLYMSGNILTVAVCGVKPYKLIPRDKDKVENDDEKYYNEKENEERQDVIGDNEHVKENDEIENEVDVTEDIIGAKYMEMEKSICFFENAIYTIEVSDESTRGKR